MSSFLWISVICIIVIPRKVLQCSFEDTFGDIVHKLQLTSTVEKVSISNNAMFVDVPLNTPLSLCDQFKCMFVCINVSLSDNSCSASTSTHSLISYSQKYNYIHLTFFFPPAIGSLFLVQLHVRET